jgi:hypothetical protein
VVVHDGDRAPKLLQHRRIRVARDPEDVEPRVDLQVALVRLVDEEGEAINALGLSDLAPRRRVGELRVEPRPVTAVDLDEDVRAADPLRVVEHVDGRRLRPKRPVLPLAIDPQRTEVLGGGSRDPQRQHKKDRCGI